MKAHENEIELAVRGFAFGVPASLCKVFVSFLEYMASLLVFRLRFTGFDQIMGCAALLPVAHLAYLQYWISLHLLKSLNNPMKLVCIIC